jgi:Na+/phosphate symporter
MGIQPFLEWLNISNEEDVRKMHERLRASLLRSEVKKLSEEKRSLYQFVIELEDSLVEIAETADHFLSLLAEKSPYERASQHFGLPVIKVIRLINDIEEELNEKVERRYERSKWIDYTDQLKQMGAVEGEKQLFLFIN